MIQDTSWGPCRVKGCSQGRLYGRGSPALVFKGEGRFRQAEGGRNKSMEGENAINPMISRPAGNRAPAIAFFGLSSGLTPSCSPKVGQLTTNCHLGLLPACPAHDSCDKFITNITPPEAGSQPSPLVQRTKSTNRGSSRTGNCEKCLPGCLL